MLPKGTVINSDESPVLSIKDANGNKCSVSGTFQWVIQLGKLTTKTKFLVYPIPAAPVIFGC